MAWVLPGSFLSSRYSEQVRTHITKHFKAVTAISLTERLFISEGTEEATIILLADGYTKNSKPSHITMECVDTVDQMRERLLGNPAIHDSSIMVSMRGTGLLPVEAIHAYESFCDEEIVSLGQLANIQIGLVTGDVPFFIKSAGEWSRRGIGAVDTRYIIPKSKWVHGITLDENDAAQHIADDAPCLAICYHQESASKAAKEFLASYPEEKKRKNVTFRKRAVWHNFFDERLPQAFLVFMTHVGPKLILNQAGANCTNSLYRVFFKTTQSLASQKLMVISMLTTYSQFGAELLGQGRGAGALKLEPSHCRDLRLYLPTRKSLTHLNNTFEEIDGLLRKGLHDKARKMADAYVFGGVSENVELLKKLETGLLVGRARRMRLNTETSGS